MHLEYIISSRTLAMKKNREKLPIITYWDGIDLIAYWPLPGAFIFSSVFFQGWRQLFTFPIASISFPSYVEDGVIFTFHSVVLHIGQQMLLTCAKLSYYFIFFSCKSLYFTLLIFPQLLEAAPVSSKFCGR